MALIFSRSTACFYHFKFRVSPNQVAVTSLPMIRDTQFTRGLSGLGAMLQPKPKSFSEFKDALQLIWSALPEKAIDNTERLLQVTAGMCVSQRWTF